MSVKTAATLCLILGFVSYAQSESCRTAKGESGDCIIIRSCQTMLNILQKRPVSPDDADYLRRSQCGFVGNDPKVCCPTNNGGGGGGGGGNSGGSNYNSGSAGGLSSNLLPTFKQCGQSAQDRIVGGETTDLDEFPWMALIEYEKPNGRGFYCGGVLINKRYVLTAAHCLKGKDLPRTWKLSSVRFGEYNTSSVKDCLSDGAGGFDCSEPPVDIPVEERIAHEKYNPLDTNQYHDIALLRLSRDAPYTAYINPICLPIKKTELQKDLTGDNLFVAGWGKTESKSESDVKLKLKVPVKSNSECSSVYSAARVNLGKGQMCAGGQKGKDSCRGDSGGPLMSLVQDSDEVYWVVSGIVSFGPSPCGMQGWPGVYTRVTEYADWIISKLKP
ncbi:PREDICTED: serine protease easter-like isoform X2 [Nicrophorus vespilloides]|uniref:CLIP domain-containing serine protease n=1 Tax=Nicrophorus vespilloides TaxID=110193 RepID=A0ABM1MR54_NICVS|nr:PREDICTED: serine protease easter-like isoform X2 [Nicrophorus vespilloides]